MYWDNTFIALLSCVSNITDTLSRHCVTSGWMCTWTGIGAVWSKSVCRTICNNILLNIPCHHTYNFTHLKILKNVFTMKIIMENHCSYLTSILDDIDSEQDGCCWDSSLRMSFMYLPSEQFTPLLPAMHAQRPSNRLHVSLTPHVQFSWQFIPKRVELHSNDKIYQLIWNLKETKR